VKFGRDVVTGRARFWIPLRSIRTLFLRREGGHENVPGNRRRGMRPCARRLLGSEFEPAEFECRIDLFDPPSTATLTIQSNPPGAEARPSGGGLCRTPCELPVPLNEGFTVTYTLDGYLPQTVSVRSIGAQKRALIDMTPARLEPNPVLAELQPAPPSLPEPPPRGTMIVRSSTIPK
jgi:PEGA domain